MNSVSDWDLMARTRSGDTHAFAELVRRYQRPVIHFCQRMLGSLEDAEDVAQETFVRVYRHAPRLKPKAKFATVVFGIARNLALNHLRDGKRRGRHAARSMTQSDAVEQPIPDSSTRPDRETRLREIEALVTRGLAMLSPEHREVLVLRELEGFDYGTIARIVRCRDGTVKSRLARAREQLRMHLVSLGGELL